MRQKFELRRATAATAAWLFAARNSSRAADPPAATAARAATSSWNPASATTRWCISASIPSTPRSADATAKVRTKPATTATGIILKVPVGTIVFDDETGDKLFEFTQPDQSFVIARGGRGGRGNARFATSVHQAPREHEEGRPGEEHTYRLELKLLADVGLVGYPNVGKSTLISRISAARPKIADYPFTTLEPNLGVVAVGDLRDEISFVVADIPGLIEGAHEGAGLGTQFLRHIERTRLLVHLVDVSDSSGRPDVVKDVEVIEGELSSFGAHLEDKPTIMAASKIDVVNKDKLSALKRYCKKHKLKLYEISAVTGKGIEELKYAMGEEVQKLREREREAVGEKP